MTTYNHRDEEFYILLSLLLFPLFLLNYLNIFQIIFLYLFFIIFKVYLDIILLEIKYIIKGILYYE